MKYIIHMMDKYDDLAETLGGLFILLLTAGAILGLAPAIMWLQINTWYSLKMKSGGGKKLPPFFCKKHCTF